MTKKVLLTLGILAVVGVVLFLIFGRQSETTTESSPGFSIGDFMPFGGSSSQISTSTETGENSTTTQGGEIILNQPVPRLRKISGEPVAGAVVFNIVTTSVVRFVEKGTGNVYEARSDSNLVERLTNTTIPKIVRAFWLPNGSGFLGQTLLPGREIIETSLVKLSKKTGAASMSESLTQFKTDVSQLPTGIKEITVKPDGLKIFYYTVSPNSNWFISNPDGTKASQVFSSPLTEWIPKWISTNSIMVQTKESYAAKTLKYTFDVPSKSLKNQEVSDPGISQETGTLNEKCVSTNGKNPVVYCAIPDNFPSGKYPDDWYKGSVSTDDSMVRFESKNSLADGILDLSRESGQKIDVVNIAISPDNSHLIFRNKIDGYLWMLRIGE